MNFYSDWNGVEHEIRTGNNIGLIEPEVAEPRWRPVRSRKWVHIVGLTQEKNVNGKYSTITRTGNLTAQVRMSSNIVVNVLSNLAVAKQKMKVFHFADKTETNFQRCENGKLNGTSQNVVGYYRK